MANVVDCSVETVEKEWARIRIEHKVAPPVDYTEQVEKQAIESVSTPEQPETSGAQWAVEKQDVLSRWLSKGMQTVFITVLKLDVSVTAFDEFAALSAEMLGKYYPNLSAWEIIAKFERELMWGWSALMLAVALFKGFRLKAAKNKTEVLEGEIVENGE